MTNATTPEWADIIGEALDTRLADLHTAMPGQVTYVYSSPDLALQYVDVRPCIRHAVPTDAEDMDATVPWTEEDMPILQRVPIAFPQGGGFAITWPIAVNDFVLLVFAERSLRYWLATARKASTSTVSAEDIDPHTLDGAVALPLGPAPLGELLLHIDSSSMILGSQLSSSRGRVVLWHDDIQLGVPSPFGPPYETTSPVARDDKTFAELERIAADLSRLVAATSTAIGAVPGGGAAKTAFDLAVGETAPPLTKVPSDPSHVGSDHVNTL